MDAQPQTLKDLQVSIKEIDALRLSKNLTDSEREALDLTAVALRDSERKAIAIMQKQWIKDIEEQTATISAQARTIRARVTKMNKTSKILDQIESAIKTAVKIIAAIAKW